MSTLTNEQLRNIKARCEAATDGPWVEGIRGPDPAVVMAGGVCAAIVKRDMDACFIAHSRTDIPDLLAHIEEQLPRTLTWTAEVPKVAGVYFRLCDNLECEGKKSDTIKIWHTNISVSQIHTGYCITPNKSCDKCRWAGPIPAPKEHAA